MRYIFLFLFILFGYKSFSQIQGSQNLEEREASRSSIVDDSTKQVYGPFTTQYTLEENIKYNKEKWYYLDTLAEDFHKYQFIAKTNNTYQNLGNIGTAFSPIFPQAPDVIGARLGFKIYDYYFQDPEKIRIYDTKSPYSKFGFVWGGKGRSVTDVAYTRNIDSRSNFGFDYRGLFIDKQVDRLRRGDRNVLGTHYNLHGNYSTKNKRYFVTANFSRNRHKVSEYGGILFQEGGSIRQYYTETRSGSLSEAETQELRTNYHLYQQYKLNDQIQFYHSHDRFKQLNDFINTSSNGVETDSAYFGFVEIDSLPVMDRSKLISRQHEVGIKGDIGKTFYSFYYRGREVNLDFKYIDEGELEYGTYYMENYGGFSLRFGNDSISYIGVSGEYLSGENYKLNSEIRNSWFYAKGSSSRYLPTYVQRAYLSRHNNWNNNFESTINTKVTGGLDFKYKGIKLNPEVSYNLITDYVYFTKAVSTQSDTVFTVQPFQTTGDISIINSKVRASVDFLKHFYLSGEFIYSNVSGGSADAIQLPETIVNAQLAYKNVFYDGNLQFIFGVDFHQRKAYYANGYDVASMQYYVQTDEKVNSFPLIDIFMDIRINRGRAFLKVNNIKQKFDGIGYLITPGYPGQGTILDFGIDWILFD